MEGRLEGAERMLAVNTRKTNAITAALTTQQQAFDALTRNQAYTHRALVNRVAICNQLMCILIIAGGILHVNQLWASYVTQDSDPHK
jgi:hypothetical protein